MYVSHSTKKEYSRKHEDTYASPPLQKLPLHRRNVLGLPLLTLAGVRPLQRLLRRPSSGRHPYRDAEQPFPSEKLEHEPAAHTDRHAAAALPGRVSLGRAAIPARLPRGDQPASRRAAATSGKRAAGSL